jgi:hypothetical protein
MVAAGDGKNGRPNFRSHPILIVREEDNNV